MRLQYMINGCKLRCKQAQADFFPLRYFGHLSEISQNFLSSFVFWHFSTSLI